jgi:hypothetical protein
MTVRANKPAFNIREKLKSLDYSHVPYEKMPSGSVIQYATVDSSSNVSVNSSSYANLSNVTLNFSPRFVSSILEITLIGTIRFNTTGNGRSRPDFRLVKSGVVVSGYNFSESLQIRNLNFNSSSVELNIPFKFVVHDIADTLETIDYTWQWRNIDNQYIDLSGVTYRQTIMEIRQ